MNDLSRPALFLDRDGVINVDYAYVYRKEDFHFIDGIFELVVTANELGFVVVVITNQAGIGRGYYSESDFKELTVWMCSQFSGHGAKIDEVYYCPYHPEHGVGKYLRNSSYRKPAPGMLLQAEKELGLDLAKSIVVGDKLTDIQAGQKAGVGHLFHFGGECSAAVCVDQLRDIIPYLHSIVGAS